MKFGLLTNPANNILEEIKLIKKMGFDYVEIGIEPPGGSSKIIYKNKNKILNLIKKFSSSNLAHTAWWIDFGSFYEYVRRGWVEEAKRSINLAKLLNINKINFHFYSIGLTEEFKHYHKNILFNIVKSLREVVKFAEDKKIIVMLENSPKPKSVVSIQQYKFVIDNVPKLKVHLDIGHAFVENGMKGIKDYIFTFRDKIEHIHISDNNGEFDEHLPLGNGKIDLHQVIKWLKQINYNKTITFEIFTSKKDAKESMIKFKKLLE